VTRGDVEAVKFIQARKFKDSGVRKLPTQRGESRVREKDEEVYAPSAERDAVRIGFARLVKSSFFEKRSIKMSPVCYLRQDRSRCLEINPTQSIQSKASRRRKSCPENT